MINIDLLTENVINGKQITKNEAMDLCKQPLDLICKCADSIRRHFCSNQFDICTIVNAKSGKCSENCKFCAQSAHNYTGVNTYPLLSEEEILSDAKKVKEQGVYRYSIVTSGRCLSDVEVEEVCGIVKRICKELGISVCVSCGLLNAEQYQKLKNAGVTRIHNNLETSKNNFQNICTTHSFDDKIRAIKAAQSVGLTVCSGGIMGLGETWEDRIDMAIALRELGIKSIPVNILNPICGTPLENQKKLTEDEIRRIIAIYRFILPDAFIRLAGGRGLIKDKGKSCFKSGANAAISGDMLTTQGITVQKDKELLKQLGYEVKK